jgi:hypothetical protein
MQRERSHVVVVEDDPFPRLLQVILDPACDPARVEAFRHFLSLDLSDFDGWLARARAAAGPLHPAKVLLADSQAALHVALPEATVVVTESFRIGTDELALAPRLQAVQKYGQVLRNVDTAACAARGVPVLTVRRRANIACAEHTMMLMLALAKRLPEVMGRISLRQLREAGFEPRTYDRRHTANSNWAGVGGLRLLLLPGASTAWASLHGAPAASHARSGSVRARSSKLCAQSPKEPTPGKTTAVHSSIFSGSSQRMTSAPACCSAFSTLRRLPLP